MQLTVLAFCPAQPSPATHRKIRTWRHSYAASFLPQWSPTTRNVPTSFLSYHSFCEYMALFYPEASNTMTTWLSWPFASNTTEDDQRKVITMFGPCQCRVAIQGATFHCDCKTGFIRHPSTSINLGELCLTCGHALREHGDVRDDTSSTLVPSTSVPHVHADSGLSNTTSPRSTYIEMLACLIDKYGVIHVRGTPASGKSTMAKLLYRHYSRHSNIVFVADWRDWAENAKDTVGFLLRQCHKLGHKIQRENFINEANDKLIFILDEAQVSYCDLFFWYSILKDRLAVDKGPRFCLFTSYGSPSTGSPDCLQGTTPPILKRGQRISLIASQDDTGPGVSLFYRREEFNDVVQRFVANADHTIGEDVTTYIFAHTNGHPGVAGAMLRYVTLLYRDRFKRSGVSHLTYQHVGDALEDNRELFEFLRYDVAGRSLPSKERLQDVDPSVISVLLRILTHGSLKFNKDDVGMEKCFRLGFIHVDEPKEGSMICVLPSLMHARFVEYTYGLSMTRPLPDTTYPNIKVLASKVLQRFSRTMLCMAEQGQRYGPSGQPRPLEAAYQDEYYRCLAEEVGPDVGIVSEWSCVGQGRIDFHLITPGWGFEILRDGDRLVDHCERFKPHGIYHQSVQQGLLKDWLILDCRRSVPRRHYSEPKLWRVVFSQDYSCVKILNGSNQQIHPEFSLSNH